MVETMHRVLKIAILLLATSAVAQHQHGSAPPSDAGQAMEHSASAMEAHHLDSGPHMKMTGLRALHAGDQQKADAVLEGARHAAEKYRDYRTALADGFQIFLPNLPQKMYHFTNYEYGFEAVFGLNPEHPTSLLYEKQREGGYKLIGVMYTAPKSVGADELARRIPLSVAQWHAHVNFCAPPEGRHDEMFQPSPKFGLTGSIATRADCDKAGGRFSPQVFGWMVHVYPLEKDTAQIWSAERQMEHSGH